MDYVAVSENDLLIFVCRAVLMVLNCQLKISVMTTTGIYE